MRLVDEKKLKAVQVRMRFGDVHNCPIFSSINLIMGADLKQKKIVFCLILVLNDIKDDTEFISHTACP